MGTIWAKLRLIGWMRLIGWIQSDALPQLLVSHQSFIPLINKQESFSHLKVPVGRFPVSRHQMADTTQLNGQYK